MFCLDLMISVLVITGPVEGVWKVCGGVWKIGGGICSTLSDVEITTSGVVACDVALAEVDG